MAKRRLSMRKIEEVLRLKRDHKLSNRQIATSCSISHSTVKETSSGLSRLDSHSLCLMTLTMLLWKTCFSLKHKGKHLLRATK